MRTRGRTRLFVLSTLSLLAILGLGSYLYASQNSLLWHARRAANTYRWKVSAYEMMPDGRVLALRHDGEGGLCPIRVDPANGNWNEMTPLDRPLKKLAWPGRHHHLSPDGNWLLWYVESGGAPRWVALRLEDNRVVVRSAIQGVDGAAPRIEPRVNRLPNYQQYVGDKASLIDPIAPATPYAGIYASGSAWLADSSGWTHLVRNHERLYLKTSLLTQAKPARLAEIAAPTGKGWDYGDLNLVGVTPGCEAVACIWERSDFNAQRLVQFDTRQARPQASLFRIRLPEPALVEEIRMSPQGNRLAWRVTVAQRSQIRALWRRLTHHPDPDAMEYSTELWVSRLDGSDLHSLGRVTPNPGKHDMGPDTAKNIRWSADGRRLAFIYRHMLYTVPVG